MTMRYRKKIGAPLVRHYPVWVGFVMLRLMAIAAPAYAGQVSLPAGTGWVMARTDGFPVQGVGWETMVYAKAIKKHIYLGGYHVPGSEPNQALVAYDFAANRWDVVSMTGQFHSETMPEAGHPSTGFGYNPNDN